ncbi:hypothetical protein R6Q57_023122 [Mikania cordata]
MEARFGGNPHHYYGPVIPELKAGGKRAMEWDLNDWNWDGDLFTATPINAISSDCRSRQLFPVTSGAEAITVVSNSSSSCSGEGKKEPEKRTRAVVLDEEDEVGALNLNLGRHVYPITEDELERWDGKNGKKSKVGGGTSNRAVCQVDNCQADLTGAKDYHRRHKVCTLHSKATKALVGNVMQRFCQQCSRFHSLEEFDEGKRSCRRRLAGHNRRRRKTHPENPTNGVTLNDERSCSYLLVSLLRILSNVQSNNTSSSEQSKDQDLLSHLLRNLASLAGTVNDKNSSASQCLQDAGTSFATPEKEPLQPVIQSVNILGTEMTQRGTLQTPTPGQITFPLNNKAPGEDGKTKLNNIDLNMVYDDSQDCGFENPENTDNLPLWLRHQPQKSSPPHTSGNSGSTATQSPSSSSGEAQSRTDRIVFKLFGKDPNELPLVLRNQILDWLLHSPTDIEGYIRPGCIILAVYLRMENSSWDELCYDLSSHMRKLLDASSNSFWRTGWVYTRVLDHVAFACDGQVILNASLPHYKGDRNSSILNISPIAVSASVTAQFSIKGVNIPWSTSRMMCILEGSYLVQTNCSELMEAADSYNKHEDIQSFNFSCSIPNISGRGFIEIEDDSLNSSFFPFIVAEPEVCSEICMLENDLAIITTDDNEKEKKGIKERTRALEFVNEMGWLLHRSLLKVRLTSMDPNSDLFSLERFRWLIEFSIDHEWCAVVKKLLAIIFGGMVDTADHGSVEAALVEVGLLHRAVRRNSNTMVKLLLNYGEQNGTGPALFRPDAAGPGGLTPLHIASGKDGSESVLDALTNDTQLVGLDAWRNCRDSSGLTPYDYASLRGHYNYIHLVQRKINKKRSDMGHVVLDIPPHKMAGFETEKAAMGRPVVVQKSCNRCERKLSYYGGGRSSLAIYKPAMLSMVAIAAVCVCVALLFKSSPQVMYVFQPFIWERLKYGAS